MWGSGSAASKVMFVGEAPGRNEDEGGQPFIGAAGKMLDGFLEHATLKRDEIYITNVAKCRPPQNRKPAPGEIEACRPYLLEQIKEVNPEVIVALGATAAHALTGTTGPMSELANTFSRIKIAGGMRTVLVSYHPAATIYNRALTEEFLAGADVLVGLLGDVKLASPECAENSDVAAELRLTSTSEQATAEYGAHLAAHARSGDVVVLTGDLAAGKTHFAQGFAHGLGLNQNVPSPTFNLVLEYRNGRLPFYHFDLYRLNKAEELEDIDFYSIVESDGVSLIEWGEKFSEALSEADLEIEIETADETTRTLTFRARTPRGQEWIATYV